MQVKGTAVATIPLFVRSKFGDQGYAKWIEQLSEPAKRDMSANILASSWYPLREMLVDPTLLICTMFYGGKMEGATEQGRFSADHGLKGVYRLFVKLGSTDFIVGKASSILPTFYQDSAMEVVAKGAKTTTVRITKFEEPHAVIEHRIKGWIERALEISGAKTPSCRIGSSMASGAPYTDFFITWQ